MSWAKRVRYSNVALLAQAQTNHEVLEVQREMIRGRREAIQVQREVSQINRVMVEATLRAMLEAQGCCEMMSG